MQKEQDKLKKRHQQEARKAQNDDIDEVTGEVLKDWIQCTDKNRGVWAHIDCLEKQIHGYLCGLCFNFIK